MCVQDIDFLGSQVAHKSPQLHYRVAIVKTVQRIRRDVIEVQVFDLGAEHALRIEAGKLNSEPIAFVQEASELDGLTLRSALMETVNQLKNNWFQYSNGPHLEPAREAMTILPSRSRGRWRNNRVTETVSRSRHQTCAAGTSICLRPAGSRLD